MTALPQWGWPYPQRVPNPHRTTPAGHIGVLPHRWDSRSMQSPSLIRSTEGRGAASARDRLSTHTFASPVVRPLPRPVASLDSPGIW
jgi:hypothetical protein